MTASAGVRRRLHGRFGPMLTPEQRLAIPTAQPSIVPTDPLRPLYLRRQGPSVLPDPRDRPVISAEEAFAELGIDRSTGYKAIRDGTFPVPVLRIGRLIRVPTVALRRLLQLDADHRAADAPTTGGEQETI